MEWIQILEMRLYMDELVSNGKVAQIIFWVIWTILIIGVIFGFYYLDNEWLE